ncbi:hypothetical protein MRS44_002289 [Fusarium solani]|uniref:uncharacterized protein n=1 Tax=Fusarium solani TaxID=169388 RepID=UPI00230A51D2|nr:hypothetical protein MRS44_002289 [Fusarium solani]KAJ4218511.1 hypothetical protein NW759_008406 [Fusarium solani]
MAVPTIHNVLAMPTPNFTLNADNPWGVRDCPTWTRIQSRHVRQWDAFNLNNLSSAFGNILRQPTSVGMGAMGTDREFRNLAEMKSHAIDSLLKIVEGPVATIGQLLGQRLESVTVVDHVRDVALPEGTRHYTPSLTFYVGTTTRAYLVVSCVRLSANWTSEGLKEQQANSLSPLCQLAKYAKLSGTRYGFIMTDKEVVVVRFIVDSTGQYGAEWQAIPQSASGEGTLTVGLAVWALIMMSLHESHRAVATEAETLPINLWWREQGVDGKFTYSHHLSGRELPYLHSGAVYRDS